MHTIGLIFPLLDSHEINCSIIFTSPIILFMDTLDWIDNARVPAKYNAYY